MNTVQKNKSANTAEMSREDGFQFLFQMLLIRRFEEKSAELYTQGKIRGFLHLYVGEEAIAVGVINSLRTQDTILSTYREHGHALARGIDPGLIMAEMFGKAEGCSRGRGGSMHLFDKKTKFIGGNAIVAGHLPLAVGLALADKKMKRDQITCCFFGEGAVAEGEFHEALNLASLWKVPVLFVCENNLYAMGTALHYTHAETQLEKKALSYNMNVSSVDGMNLPEVLSTASTVLELIKKTGNPHLLICNTYRFRAHSMFDAELYRDKKEVTEWKKRDPIILFTNYLKENKMMDDNLFNELELKVSGEIEKAIVFAENGSNESINQLTKYVYSEI